MIKNKIGYIWTKQESRYVCGGLETSQQGVNMHASYDQMFAEAKICRYRIRRIYL